MKKILKRVTAFALTLIMVLSSFAMQLAYASTAASAEIRVKDTSVTVSSEKATIAYVPVLISGNPGIVGAVLRFDLPAGWKLGAFDLENGNNRSIAYVYDEDWGEWNTSVKIEVNKDTNKVVWGDTVNSTATEGYLGWLKVQIPKAEVNGTYTIGVEADEISKSLGNKQFENVLTKFTMTAGTVTVTGGADPYPNVITHPVGGEFAYGSNPTLTLVDAKAEEFTGTYAPTYQWYEKTNPEAQATAIDGATTASYTPAGLDVGTYYYYCVVSNEYNGVNYSDADSCSKVATVTVNPAEISSVDVSIETPVKNADPQSTIAGTAQYDAAITWSPEASSKFAANTVYTATVVLTIKDSNYKFADSVTATDIGTFAPAADGTLTITKTFAKTADRELTGIVITKIPNKVNYVDTEPFDKTGMIVTASFDNGDTEEITNYSVSHTTMSLNDTVVTVSYGGKTATVNVTVEENSLQGIAVGGAFTKNYTVGDTADWSGMVVTATYKYGSKVVTPNEITGFDSAKYATSQTITVTYTENNITKTADFTVVINRKTTTADDVNVSLPTGAVYSGESYEATATPGVGVGAITFKYNNETTKPTNAGTYAVTYDVAETDTHSAVTGASAGTFTIAKADPSVTVSVTSIAVKMEGSSQAIVVTVPSDSTGDVTYSIEDPTVATWDATNKKVVGGTAVDTTNLIVTFAGDNNYNAKEVTVPVSVTALDPQVFADGFAGNVAKTYGDAEFTRAADLTTGTGEITYESEDESVAIVNDDGKVTIKGAGTTTITATAAKVIGVYAETSVSYTLIVDQKEVGLTWAGHKNLEYSGNPVNVTATATGVMLGDTVTVTVTGGAETNAGDYTATAAELDNDNYKLPDVKTQPYTIARKVIDVPTANTLTYNSEVQTGVDADDEGTYTVTGNTGTNVGNYTAVVTPTSNYKWDDSTDGKEVSWSISAYDVTGTAVTDTTNKTQNVVVNVGTFVAPTFTGFKGETVNGAVAYSYESLTDKAAIEAALAELGKGDTAEITYTFTAAGNYTGTKTGTIAVTMVDIAFKVGSADATAENAVTIKSAPAYGDTWAEIVTIGDIKASVDGAEVEGTYILNVSGMPNAGEQTYEVIFNAADTTKYQNVKVLAGTVNVAQKEVAVVWSNLTKTYNGQTQHPNASATGVNEQAIPVSTSFTVATQDAGTYTCTATTTDSNYLLTNNTAEFTISPVEVTAVWSDTTVTYNGEAQYPLATVRTGITGEALTVGISMNENAVDAGTYTATVRISDGVVAKASNYKLVGDTQAAFTVNPAKATVNWANTSLTYNGQEQAPTATATGVKNENIVLTVSGAKINKGSYTATASTENGNYTLEGASVDYTIAAKNLTIGVESIADVTYTGSAHTPSVILTGTDGFNLVKDTDYTVKYTDNKVAGTATVTVTVKSTSNFTFEEVTTNFTILKADVTVSAEDMELEYTGIELDASAIKGTALFGTKAIAGSWSWVGAPGTGTGDYICVVKFTPDDADNFMMPGNVVILVKITPVKITSEDIQLDTEGDVGKYADMSLAELLEDLLKGVFGGFFEDLFNAGAITIEKNGERMSVSELENARVTANTDYTVVIDTTVLAEDSVLANLKEVVESHFAIGEDGVLSSVVTPYVDRNEENFGCVVKVMPAVNGSVDVNSTYAKEGTNITVIVKADDGYEVDGLKVVGDRDREIRVADLGNGMYSFVMPNTIVYVQASFKAVSTETLIAFVDVAEKDWYYNAVCYVYNAGLMNGTGNGYFSPAVNVSRSMMMTLLARLDGMDTTGGEFWYSKGMEWAMAEGISDGSNPNGEITREQAVTMMYRFMGSPAVAGDCLDNFTDGTSVSGWAKDGMNWAISIGLIQGNAGKLNPTSTASRAEIATMLMRFVENVIK